MKTKLTKTKYPNVEAPVADIKKFGELILYIAKKSESDPDFGATKLNKILFYSDFTAYGRTGKSITGQEYKKQEFGPVPTALPRVSQNLIKRGTCAIQERRHFGLRQSRLIALREPDLEAFSGVEIAIVDELIEKMGGMTGKDVSLHSHKLAAWEAFELNEVIPYTIAFISPQLLTAKERRYGLELESSLAKS
jgi:hypothetical protein